MAMARGQYREGIEWLHESERLYEANKAPVSALRVRLFAAHAHYRRGDLSALATATQAIIQDFETHFYGAHWASLLGATAARAGLLDEAKRIQVLVEAKARQDNKAERRAVLRLRGELDIVEGRLESARESFEAASILRSTLLEKEALARIHYRLGGHEQAYRIYAEVAASHALGWEGQDRWVEAHYWLGRIEQERENFVESVGWYDRLIEIWANADANLPLLKDVHERRATILTMVGG
jgi:tetratricopeptide (TPR) repeat protein